MFRVWLCMMRNWMTECIIHPLLVTENVKKKADIEETEAMFPIL